MLVAWPFRGHDVTQWGAAPSWPLELAQNKLPLASPRPSCQKALIPSAHGLNFISWLATLPTLTWRSADSHLGVLVTKAVSIHEAAPFGSMSVQVHVVSNTALSGCRILVPCPGIEPVPLLVKAWSPNHWTAREVRTETFDKSINIRPCKSWSYIYHHTLLFQNNYSHKTFLPNKLFC